MYLANVQVLHTVADAAGSAVWAAHVPLQGSNEKKKRIFLRHIWLNGASHATTATAAHVGHELIKFTVADPTTGTTVARIKTRPVQGASIIADANIQQKSGGLTMTSVVYDGGPFAVLIGHNANGNNRLLRMEFDPFHFAIEPDEGLAIRVAAGLSAVAGLGLSGFVAWDEEEIR